jgi:hypothetical protein
VAQKHAARLPHALAVSQGTWSAPQTVSADPRPLVLHFSATYRPHKATKFLESGASCESGANISLKGDATIDARVTFAGATVATAEHWMESSYNLNGTPFLSLQA